MKKNISNHPKHARQSCPSCNPVQKTKSPSSHDATLAARKAKTLELLAQDRQKLLTKLPFTGSLVVRLDLVPVIDERIPTAATDGDRIFLDIDFYAKLVTSCYGGSRRWLPPALRHVHEGLYLQSMRSERLRDRVPAYPVMWLLTKDGECAIDWGMQVKFKE